MAEEQMLAAQHLCEKCSGFLIVGLPLVLEPLLAVVVLPPDPVCPSKPEHQFEPEADRESKSRIQLQKIILPKENTRAL